MTMLVIKAGTISQPVSLGALLRHAHDEREKQKLARTKTRKESGASSDDLPPGALDERPYPYAAEFDGVLVRFRAPRFDEVAEHQLKMDLITRRKNVAELSLEEALRVRLDEERATQECMRELLRLVVHSVTGLAEEVRDESGALIEERAMTLSMDDAKHVEHLADADMIVVLYAAAQIWHRLPVSQKKSFGGSPSTISGSSSATPATPRGVALLDATAEPPSARPTPTPSTSARGDSSSTKSGSA